MRFPRGVHAASPLTSSANAHDDELGCHRLAAGGGFANSLTICTVKTFTSSRHGHTHRQGLIHTHITHTETHALPQLTRTHTLTDRDSYTHTNIDTHTQRPTHYLNSLDLTLHTEHLTDNSHSDFLRDEKCIRATRRLVFLGWDSYNKRWTRSGKARGGCCFTWQLHLAERPQRR